MPAPLQRDLRAGVDFVDYQGHTVYCFGFGMVKTPLECLLQRAGIKRRVSALWAFWRARELAGELHLGANEGSGPGFERVAQVLEGIGYLFEDQYRDDVPPSALDGLARANGRCRVSRPIARPVPTPGNSMLAGIRRSIAMGVPITLAINIRQGFWEQTNTGKPWQLHGPWPADGAILSDKHICCGVGIDDVAGATCIEDSSGANAFDGGFWGLDHSLADNPAVVADAARIDWIERVPMPIDDIGEAAADTLGQRQVGLWFDLNAHALTDDVVAAYTGGRKPVLWTEALANFERASPLLRAAGGQAAEQGGVPALLDWCRAHGITDHLLEVLAGWARHTVRRHFDAHGLDVNAIEWAPL